MEIDELIRRFFEELNRRVDSDVARPATRKGYLYTIPKWRKTLPPEVMLVEQLKREHLSVKSWHVSMSVKTLFKWAFDEEIIPRSPFARVKLRKRPGRQRVLTRDEMAKFIVGAKRTARWIYVFLRWSLARPREIRELRWRDYHQRTGARDGEMVIVREFVLTDFKMRDKRRDRCPTRVIPVHPFLARILRIWFERRKPSPNDFIFKNRFNQPWTQDAFRQETRRACDRARLSIPGGENIVAYHFRHTMATQFALNSVQYKLLSSILGHASLEMTWRYVHFDSSGLAEAVERGHLRIRKPAKIGEPSC